MTNIPAEEGITCVSETLTYNTISETTTVTIQHYQSEDVHI